LEGQLHTTWLPAAGALLAAIWLALGHKAPLFALLDRPMRADSARAKLALAGLLVVGVGASVLGGGGVKRINRWDTYHYYMGAKYFPELGYRGLYDCTLAADLQADRAGDLTRRNIRDMETLRLERADMARERAEHCRKAFSPARWRAFRSDLGWFRAGMTDGRWFDMQKVHGFMATPVWILMGRLFTSVGPASDLQLLLLTSLDDLIMGLAWLVVLLGFGFRPALAAAAFWLTNYPARFSWTAGSFLRQPYLALSMCGLGWLRQGGRELAAGAALASATLLRLGPGVLLVGPAMGVARALFGRQRPRLAPEQRRFLAGAALAAAVLLPAASLAVSGMEGWLGFAKKFRDKQATTLTTTMGLKVVASFSPSSRERVVSRQDGPRRYTLWQQGRKSTFQQRRPIFYLMVAGFLLLLWRATRGLPAWHAAALSAGLLPVALESNCYYMALLLPHGLLAGVSDIAAVGLNLFACASRLIPLITPWFDEQYLAMSVLVVLLAVVAAAREAI